MGVTAAWASQRRGRHNGEGVKAAWAKKRRGHFRGTSKMGDTDAASPRRIRHSEIPEMKPACGSHNKVRRQPCSAGLKKATPPARRSSSGSRRTARAVERRRRHRRHRRRAEPAGPYQVESLSPHRFSEPRAGECMKSYLISDLTMLPCRQC